jgi:chromosome segregation ATPase
MAILLEVVVMVEREKDLEQRLRDLQAHVDRAQEAQRELETAVTDMNHQSRRLGDRIERGDRTDGIEQERQRLRAGIEANRRDQQSNSEQLEQLRREREELEQRLRELKENGKSR